MVIFCIGSPAVSGDSVAPLVGDLLIEEGIDAYVYGTTTRPITALNYPAYYDLVATLHANEVIIAIDASLGVARDIGSLKIVKGGICPGRAVGKTLPPIGEIGIMAQVGENVTAATQELMNVPFAYAIALAKRCANLVLSIV